MVEPWPLFMVRHLPSSWMAAQVMLLPVDRLLGRVWSLDALWRMLALLAVYAATGAGFIAVHHWGSILGSWLTLGWAAKPIIGAS